MQFNSTSGRVPRPRGSGTWRPLMEVAEAVPKRTTPNFRTYRGTRRTLPGTLVTKQVFKHAVSLQKESLILLVRAQPPNVRTTSSLDVRAMACPDEQFNIVLTNTLPNSRNRDTASRSRKGPSTPGWATPPWSSTRGASKSTFNILAVLGASTA